MARRTTSELGGRESRDHFLARIGYRRMEHTVEPGLWSVGEPNGHSPVFVTANYTLSFDALRSSLAGMDAYILVLDTGGINVWCAAGKGTFGTDELVRRVRESKLSEKVRHRKLILPQLGAPGVDSRAVQKETGFRVEFGPVRARDIPEYMRNGGATPEMRRVTFTLKERAVLIPIELKGVMLPMLALMVLFYFLGGLRSMLGILMIVLTGTVLFPLVLPMLPTRELTTKGMVLGVLVVVPFTLSRYGLAGPPISWDPLLRVIIGILQNVPWVAFLALNFTGATPFTSRTGVRREIFRYIPVMAVMFVIGIILEVVRSAARSQGVF